MTLLANAGEEIARLLEVEGDNAKLIDENEEPPNSDASVSDCARYFLRYCLLAITAAKKYDYPRAIKYVDTAIIHVGIVISSFRPAYRVLGQQIIDHCSTHLSRRQLDPSMAIVHQRPEVALKFPVTFSDWPCETLFEQFQLHVASSDPHPLVFKDFAKDWPATSKWSDPSYLLQIMSNGYRCIPVETGTQYTRSDWSVSIITFKDFLQHTLDGSICHYLAQYNLFNQVPELRDDIRIPDICSATAPDADFETEGVKYVYKPVPDFISPITNVWFGPADTISPLHRDEHHNIYVQVVGYKYFRLHSPRSTHIYPDTSMPNTSSVDLSDKSEEERRKFPQFSWDSGYVETILGPGDAIYIPFGWWHYVQSFSVSIGVNFWF